MIEETAEIGLVVECRLLGGKWGGYAWRPVTVFPVAPDVAAWTPLGPRGNLSRYYAGAYPIHLFSTDTANYRDNLESGAPKLWVVLRASGPEPPIEVLLVTADPAEGEGATEAGSNIVEALAMPDEIAGIVASFVAAHHVERPIIKRRRDRGEPELRWRDRASGRREDGDGS